jgi:putative hemolysin
MELGRSFIRPEYQRELAPLHLLWRGIGQLVLRHKKYRMLFGPVSISSQYNSVSVQLMINFLKANNLEADLSTMVKPRIPPKEKKTRKWNDRITSRLVNNINEVSSLVAEVEGENQGVPILIKHYVKLGGRLLGFNIDPDFGNAIDGLILVDLTKTPRRILERYLGKEETDNFLKFHLEKRRR